MLKRDRRIIGNGLLGTAGGFLMLAAFLAGCGPPPSGQPFQGEINVLLDPEQTAADGASKIILKNHGYTWMLEPKAGYLVDGIVLSKKNYGSDWNAMISPCDLALAWGQLAKAGLYKKCRWSQSGRWYYWKYGEDFPLDNNFIARWSANNHIIPASENLKAVLKRVSRGDTVRLRGYLVNITGSNGRNVYQWQSSLSREDQGDGACEVLYLTELAWRGLTYK